MHAVSVKQPYAEAIASGKKAREYRTWAPRTIVGHDLLIVASRAPGDGYAGEPQGVAICVVRVTKIVETRDGYAWCLENPRRVGPLPLKGYAALYKVDDACLTFKGGARSRSAPAATSAPRTSSKPSVPRPPRAKPMPYTFSIEDRMLRGERAATPAKARAHALALSRKHKAPITIFRDGSPIGGESA